MRRKILFTFDTTGSMRTYIERVLLDVATLSTEVLEADPDSEVGFIAYGDHCDGPRMIQDSTLPVIPSMTNFTLTPGIPSFSQSGSDIERWLSQDHGTHGGDAPEAVECVLKYIADVHVPRLPAGDQLIVFWVGDFGPHRPNDGACHNNVDWQHELSRLAASGVSIYTALCGMDAFTRTVWEKMAKDTGGIAVDLLNVKNLLTTMVAVVKKESGGLDAYAKTVRERGADAEMEEILVDLGATCYDS